MKKISIIIGILFLTGGPLWSQPPQALNYQAIVRDAQGEPVKNQEVAVRMIIYMDSATGTRVYAENHLATTNDFGNINLQIGRGTTSDSFESIDWGGGSIFLRVRVDITGGTSWTDVGTTQLLSVPYSLYSGAAMNNNDADPQNEIQNLSISNDTLYLSDGGFIKLPDMTPKGVITMWSGAMTQIPPGWALCDGSNGTPDLTDRFILSVQSASQDPGETGGSNSCTLTVAQLPPHAHSVDPPSTNTSSNGVHDHEIRTEYSGAYGTYGVMGTTNNTSGDLTRSPMYDDGLHYHSINIAAFDSDTTGTGTPIDNRPAFYRLAFIMKL